MKTEIPDTRDSLLPLFCPRSVAVIGASRNPASIGYRILDAIISNRFNGPVYPVNPSAEFVSSVKAYPSVTSCPGQVDLAVIAVPAKLVPGVIDDCVQAGVKAIVVISAGFAETGRDGKALQEVILRKVRENNIRMVGPNCMGILNAAPDISLNASFANVSPPYGNVAMSSQSGALGLAVISHAKQLNIGLSSFISVGNKADISANDLLQYWEYDHNTKVILLYIESFGNPRKFVKLTRRIGRQKPILAVKGGRTASGKRAAGSHTASLASNEIAVDALFNQTGVIRADTLEDMFDIAKILSNQPLPAGNRIGMVTNAGGFAILCADACEGGNLVLPLFSGKLQDKLHGFLPPEASVSNPVDMVASANPETYYKAIKEIISSDEIDSLVILHIPVDPKDTGKYFQSITRSVNEGRETEHGKNKTVVAVLMYDEKLLQELATQTDIPVFIFPEAAGKALSKVAQYSAWRIKPPGATMDFTDIDTEKAFNIIHGALKARGNGWLTVTEVQDVLQAFRLPVPSGGLALNEDEAMAIAGKIGYPVVLKVASHTLTHKTEVGGVYLNLKNDKDVRDAFINLKEKMIELNKESEMDGAFIQPMIKKGVEVMVGMVDDPTFGPLVAFGLGGIHVEILSDVRFRITPLTDIDAKEMIKSIKGYKLLEGYRGHRAADITALEETLLRVSQLVEAIPEISELDLNPIFALPPGKGCVIGDARIMVKGI
ncbi:MAG: acetate--CoA ligase family protein [Bacteroidetes bacterium]|nr:acetate--CoA ligase family protein [Bacteroidota bacterium]